MARTVQVTTGDGVLAPYVAVALTLPDTGTNINAEGNVAPIGGPLVPVTGGSPIAGPAVPGSGTTYWIHQANTTTGALSTKTSASLPIPSPDAGCVQIYQDSLAAGTANLAVDVNGTTTDQW